MNIKSNIFYQIIYQVLLFITPLITAPYISRVLGAQNIGISAFTYSIVGYFINIASLGISNYATRKIATKRGENKDISSTFISIYGMHFIVCLVVIIGFIGYFLISNSGYSDVLLVQGIYLFACFFDISWLYYGLENFKKITMRNIIIKILSIVCILLFVKSKDDLIIYCAILAVSHLLSQLLLWLNIKKYVKFVKVSFKEMFKHLKPMLILFLPMISVYIYRYIDKTMLGTMADMSQVGYYENSEKIINICSSMIAAVGIVFLPRMSFLYKENNLEKINKYLTNSFMIVGFLTCSMGFGLLAVSDSFVPIFFGEGYDACVEIINILAITVIFTGISNNIKSSYLLPNKKDMQFAIILFVGAAINFVLNLFIILKFGALGAAISTLVTEIVICFVEVIYIRKKIKILSYIKEILLFIVPAIVMFFVLKIIVFPVSAWYLILEICIGASIYVILVLVNMIFFKKKMLKDVFGKILKKGGKNA